MRTLLFGLGHEGCGIEHRFLDFPCTLNFRFQQWSQVVVQVMSYSSSLIVQNSGEGRFCFRSYVARSGRLGRRTCSRFAVPEIPAPPMSRAEADQAA